MKPVCLCVHPKCLLQTDDIRTSLLHTHTHARTTAQARAGTQQQQQQQQRVEKPESNPVLARPGYESILCDQLNGAIHISLPKMALKIRKLGAILTLAWGVALPKANFFFKR